jgi:hypothetical protein
MDKQSQDTIDIKIKDLEEENELLLLQLHQVQEELESYFLKCKELESNTANQNAFSAKQSPHLNQGSSQNSISITWVDDELPDALAEKTRLSTLLEVQQWIYLTESHNGLNARLAKLLTESINTSTGFLSVPSKLIGFWRSTSNKTPPSSLGEKDYDKLITVFKEGGLQGAEQLINSNNLSFTIKANAYIALARYLIKKDVKTCAKLAQLAYETDPRAYRLKWLACRLHEAGEVQKAEAMIDLLPKEINFSESESRQVDQIRYEAKRQREKHAKEISQYSKKKEQIQEQLTQLTNAKDTQAQLAQERANQIEEFKRSQASLEDKLTQLTNAKDTQAQLAQERANQIEEFKRSQASLEDKLTQLTNAKDTQTKLAIENQDRLKIINESMKLILDNQKKNIGIENLKDVESTIKKEVRGKLDNSVKQLEAFMGIQGYLSKGILLNDFHGWSISPDLGLFLLEKIQENKYDIIIEFGSGTSTALMAASIDVGKKNFHSEHSNRNVLPQAMQAYEFYDDSSRYIGQINNKENGGIDVLRYSTQITEQVWLPEIITFEHDIKFFNKTTNLLSRWGLSSQVNLFHAPLIDWSDSTGNYLYYDCKNILLSLAAKIKNKKLKLLVLVDGPPGSTCKNSRYPAVPLVFSSLGEHQIDLVLDDSRRSEEKEVIELWKGYWKSRFIHVNEVTLPSEKGIYYVNPSRL